MFKYAQLTVLGVLCTGLHLVAAEGLDPAIQAKVDAKLKEVQALASDPVLINAVKAHNASPPAAAAGMTQDKWKSLTLLDPTVREFTKNEAATTIKTKKSEAMTEAFLSGAEGTKVAFLTKTTFWCHKGKAKHDAPMTGKTWQGPIEVDESTGLQQIQVAVPVIDGGKPIGSFVVGLSMAKLGS